MKNTTKIMAGVLAGVSILTMSATYAMENGIGFGNSLTTEEKDYIHSLDDSEREEYVANLKEERGFPTSEGSHSRGGMKNGNGFGNSLTTEEKDYIHNLDDTEREEYVSKLKEERGFPTSEGSHSRGGNHKK